MKEAEDKISGTEVMSLPGHLWSHEIYCFRYKAHIKFMRSNFSEDEMRIQVESPENLKANHSVDHTAEEFEYVKKREE